jgi:Arc/MetJ-type ribon-helix-helix transcriptional regulator
MEKLRSKGGEKLQQVPPEDVARLETLRAALSAGEVSGLATDFDFDAFVARKRNELR